MLMERGEIDDLELEGKFSPAHVSLDEQFG